MTCKKTQQCSTPCNLKINGYKLFNIVDDGMYVSKSKEDLLEDVKKYGDVQEIYGVTEQELLEEMEEILLCSKQAQEEKDWADDVVKCIYDLYAEVATQNNGTEMILTYNL